jgi:succinoglycan biosynthesis protein ExoV
MKPFYWRTSTNFGDAMNSWMWDALFPDLLADDDGVRLVGIGSLLKAQLERVDGLKVIFGSGSGYGPLPARMSDRRQWRTYFVRGPLTAKAARLDEHAGIVDASWLIGLTDEFRSVPSKNGVSFVPHFSNVHLSAWKAVCHRTGFNFVDPLTESKKVLAELAASELVITESLHGAIMADYFRTPWIPVRLTTGSFLDFKWLDWCQSVGLAAQAWTLQPTDLLDHFRQGTFWSAGPARSSSIVATMPDIDTRLVPRRVTPAYRMRTKLRAKGHAMKEQIATWLGGHRESALLRPLNNRLIDAAAVQLRRTAQGEAYLSADSTRARLLDRLAAKVVEIRRDYLSGVLSDKSW